MLLPFQWILFALVNISTVQNSKSYIIKEKRRKQEIGDTCKPISCNLMFWFQNELLLDNQVHVFSWFFCIGKREWVLFVEKTKHLSEIE